jgi:hypothetical protein
MTIQRWTHNEERIKDGPMPVMKRHEFGNMVAYEDHAKVVNELLRIAIGAFLEGLRAEESEMLMAAIEGRAREKDDTKFWNTSRTKRALELIGKQPETEKAHP